MRIIVLILLFFSSYLCAVPDESPHIVLTTPLSGWMVLQGKDAAFSQTVNYPASSINLGDDQSISAQIRGKIVGLTDDNKKPGLLVVNGVPLPLRIETDGTFERPYIFSQGSNSLEVHSPDHQLITRQQFYATRGDDVIASRLRIVLSWSSDHTDLDLHVITPDGQHAWYGNPVLSNGGALDIDVTTGYGPEIFSTPAPLPGTYLVYVNFFGGQNSRCTKDNCDFTSDLTVATVSIITEEGTENEKLETFTIPMRKAGELTLVKALQY